MSRIIKSCGSCLAERLFPEHFEDEFVKVLVSVVKPEFAFFQISTTRIAGGLLWPYKGLLPAAPKDAGFHVVQAQCHCRFGLPLKGVLVFA